MVADPVPPIAKPCCNTGIPSQPEGRQLRRRDFIQGIVGSTVAWPLTASAQQSLMPVIGFLSSRSPGEAKHLVGAFRDGLRSAGGYVEGRNVTIEFRWAEGDYTRLPGLASELVHHNVAVIVAVGGEPSALAAREATTTIPIIFSIGGDPVKAGMAASLNRPGGNATGVSLLTYAPEAKRLGLLNELVPGAGVFGVLINPNFTIDRGQLEEVQNGARAVGRQVLIAKAATEEDLNAAFATFAHEGTVGVLITADPFFDTRRAQIVALASQYKLPAIYQFRDYVADGGLISYGISIADGYRQVGVYTGEVLKGAKPADLPIHQSIKFELVINLKTAKALGIKISDNLISIADEVIE
jgi:putative tryptophan/tyrosine transport system substrate-binding protein